MKNLSKLFSLLLVVMMVIVSTTTATAFAGEDSSKNVLSEVDQLKADIAEIESVDLNDLQEFYNQNKDWIEDVNTRLEEYMADIPEDQRDTVLKELRGDNPYARAASDYFDTYTYHIGVTFGHIV